MVNPKEHLQMYREWRVKGAVWGILISPQKMGSQLERQVSFVSFPHPHDKVKRHVLYTYNYIQLIYMGTFFGFKMIYMSFKSFKSFVSNWMVGFEHQRW
jgi:hypothetical protein